MAEIHVMFLAVAPDRQFQCRGQGIDAGNADTMQTSGYLVGILVEFAAGMQFGHDDFGCTALRRVLVVEFDACRNATAVIDDRNGIVGMQRDMDFGTVPGQRFVDGIVQNLENEMM